MKKNIIISAALFIICLNDLVAQQDAQVSAIVTDQFSKQFNEATNVRWEQHAKQISMARFNYGNEFWLAYFNSEGELISSGRQLPPATSLPVVVKASLSNTQKKLERKYGALTSGRVFEMISGGNTLYYIPLANEVMSFLVSIDSNGHAAIRRKAPTSAPAQDITPLIVRKD